MIKRSVGILLASTVLGASSVAAPAFAQDVQSLQQLQKQINSLQKQLRALQDQVAQTKQRAKPPEQVAQNLPRAIPPPPAAVHAKNCPEMVVLPAGQFVMGSSTNGKGRSAMRAPST